MKERERGRERESEREREGEREREIDRQGKYEGYKDRERELSITRSL